MSMFMSKKWVPVARPFNRQMRENKMGMPSTISEFESTVQEPVEQAAATEITVDIPTAEIAATPAVDATKEGE